MSKEVKDGSRETKKERESTPWPVCSISEEGIIAKQSGPYDDLKSAEKAAADQAIRDIGTTYAPVKIGTRFKAAKTERVEVKRG